MKMTTYADTLYNPAEQVELRMSKQEAGALLEVLRAVNPDNGVGYFVDDKEKPVVDELVCLLGKIGGAK